MVKGREDIIINAKITFPIGQTPVLIATQSKFIYIMPKENPLNKYKEMSSGLTMVCE